VLDSRFLRSAGEKRQRYWEPRQERINEYRGVQEVEFPPGYQKVAQKCDSCVEIKHKGCTNKEPIWLENGRSLQCLTLMRKVFRAMK
jgi:hypothetical protein